MIILWSDIFIYFVFILLISLSIYIYKSPIHLKSIQKILNQKSAVISLFILLFYFFITLIDSIHFKNQNIQGESIISFLDYTLTELSTKSEKSYSTPFSLYSLTKEVIETENGKIRDFPRLNYAGNHLNSINDYNFDIIKKLTIIFLVSIFIFFVLFGLFYFFYKFNWKEYLWLLIPVFIFIVVITFVCIFYGKYHILGTDKAGYDVFYKSIKSIRTAMIIGLLTTIIVIPTAVLFGVISGYFGGFIDDIIQYIYTTLESIPSILLIAATMLIVDTLVHNDSSFISADQKLIYLCCVLGITSWTNLCRLTRGETLKLREMEYVEAAKALGTSNFKIMLHHIVPNLINTILIVMTLHFSGAVLSEAALTYVGIGADPSIYSWGNMINQARFELARTPSIWWNLVGSFIFMLGLVLPANIFSDALRDALDPKTKD